MLRKKLEYFRNSIGKDFFELINHSKNYVTAELFNYGLAFITMPIFTRLLNPTDYGILAVLTSFIAIFGIIYSLGFKGAIVRYYYESL